MRKEGWEKEGRARYNHGAIMGGFIQPPKREYIPFYVESELAIVCAGIMGGSVVGLAGGIPSFSLPAGPLRFLWIEKWDTRGMDSLFTIADL